MRKDKQAGKEKVKNPVVGGNSGGTGESTKESLQKWYVRISQMNTSKKKSNRDVDGKETNHSTNVYAIVCMYVCVYVCVCVCVPS